MDIAFFWYLGAYIAMCIFYRRFRSFTPLAIACMVLGGPWTALAWAFLDVLYNGILREK